VQLFLDPQRRTLIHIRRIVSKLARNEQFYLAALLFSSCGCVGECGLNGEGCGCECGDDDLYVFDGCDERFLVRVVDGDDSDAECFELFGAV
jgi:hypothetical protein